SSGAGAVVPPHPAKLRVGGRWTLFVFLLEHRDLVIFDRVTPGLYVELVDSRRIQAEYFGFDLRSELLVTVFLGDIIADLEAAEPVDLALRATAPNRIRSPNDLVFHTHVKKLAEQVHGDFWPGAGGRIPG